jgi:hypothetical protein
MTVRAKQLTQELADKCGIGVNGIQIVRLVVDTKTGAVWVLEGKEQHMTIAVALSKAESITEFTKNISSFEYIVGGEVEIENGEVIGGILGVTSFEMGNRVMHLTGTLRKAEAIVRAFAKSMPAKKGFVISAPKLKAAA